MRAQVDMKIVYLALSLVMLAIFVKVVWPMVQSAEKEGLEARDEVNKTFQDT